VPTVHVVLPEGIDDPERPSGGNTYDRRVCDGMAGLGWTVRERPVPGSWPAPDDEARSRLAAELAAVPDDSLVLVDGLVASAAPEVTVPASRRLRLVVLVHMPLPGERDVLAAADAVLTTSDWTRDRLLSRHGLGPDRVHVAVPGVDESPVAPGTGPGTGLLCVAAVTPGKGHDVLVRALALVADPTWRCVCVGSLDRDRDFARDVQRQAGASGLEDRLVFTGPRVGEALDAAYADADLLVLASRGETYGMVVTEALARGLPAVATAVGGIPEALGRDSDGTRPGRLVPPDDPQALAAALERWLGDDGTRSRLRRSARERRSTLAGWAETAARVSAVLSGVAA
jgi:glycosyltransferase involved in cell wall biosynthesis